MADAERPEVSDADDEDDEDDDGAKKPKGKDWTGGKDFEYVSRTGDARTQKLTNYNIFCPTCEPPEGAETPPGQPPPGAPAGAEMAFPDARRTQLPLALVATMEAEAPGISLATIAHNEGGAGVYAEGEDILADVTLHSVDLGVVYLRTAGGLEFLPLSSGDAPPPKAPTKTEAKKSTKPNKYAIEGASDAIKCTKNSNGHSCTVERKFINQLIGNPAQLATQARARPYSKKGLEGYQLTRIRKGSIPYMMGIRTGNVIKAINGTELKSLDGAMALYARLRNAKHLTIDYVHGRKEKLYERRLEIDVI